MINPMARVHKDFKKFLEDAKMNGVKMTMASKLLLEHARNTGFNINTNFKSSVRKNKKGTVLDLITIIYTFFGFAIAIVIGYYLLTVFSATSIITTTPESNTMVQSMLAQYLVFDNLFVGGIIFLSLTTVISATLLRTTPVYFFISIFVLAIILVVGGLAVNSYQGLIGQSSELTISSLAFPKMNFVLDNFLIYLAVMGTLITIALYSFRGQQLV